MFTQETLYYSYMWVYTWLFAIYIPWVYLTNDVVYSVLDPIHPWYFRMLVVVFVHTIAYVSNYIVPCICSNNIN